jgi:hypothetical protein
MKLDRNLNEDGRGKYAVLKLRRLALFDDGKTFGGLDKKIAAAIRTLDRAGILDWGQPGTESEFFLIRLKDKYAQGCLRSYATDAARDDTEYAGEIFEMANRAGPSSPFCKRPD